jgi:hypothetical protein
MRKDPFISLCLYHRQTGQNGRQQGVVSELATTRTELQMNQICAKVVLPVN